MTPQRFEEIVAELRAALVLEQVPPSRPAPESAPIVPAQPPVVPSGDWQVEARDRALRQGFDALTVCDWDWARDGAITFDTATRGQVGARGIFVASFIATGGEDGVLAQLDAIGYPSPNQGNQLSMSLSTSPCDFTVQPPAISVSYAPTITYCLGKAPVQWWNQQATAVGLTPGVRYFLNCSGASTYQPGQFGGPEFRVALRVPQGH